MGNGYAERLGAVLEQLEWSQAELGRRLAAHTGNAVESERWNVRAYLSGKSRPAPKRAALIAQITGEDDLARVEKDRRTAAAVIDARMEKLEASIARLVVEQETIVRQLQDLTEAVRSLGEKEPDA